MALGHHVDTDKLISAASKSSGSSTERLRARFEIHDIPYASRYDVDVNISRDNLPEEGVDAKVAYQLLHDELGLDGNPNMNLATFVHTWVPDECQKLMVENLNKNLVDQDEYPAAQAIHERCVSMIAGLWNGDKAEKPTGTATTGSSEAIMLGGLALKRRWQQRMKAAGKDIYHPGPNVVMGAEVQVANEKFARYFEVDCRLVPVTKESNYLMDPKEAIKHVDENTIAVFIVLGSTYTGGFENVKEMSDLLDDYEKKTGISIPIHVDAASGGFFAPFVYPDLLWDFRLPRVHSINASGHKYGMSAVGVGWIIWRSSECLPKDLIFELHYLGEVDYSYNLNFSRPAHPILGQMFNFINLGFKGYKRIMSADLAKARILSNALEETGYFTIVSDVHRVKKIKSKAKEASDPAEPQHYEYGLPVVAFRFSDDFKKKYPEIQQRWIQLQLRGIGWIVPNYELPPNCQSTEILRVVVRESMGGESLRRLIEDIIHVAESIVNEGGPSPAMASANKKIKARAMKADGFKKNHKGHSHVC